MKAEEYLNYLKNLRNYSSATVKAYSEDLQKFEAYLNAEGLDSDEPGTTAARRFISGLSADGMSKTSVNRIMSSLKGYYRYLIKRGYTDVNPFENIRSLKKNRTLPEYLFEAEIDSLLKLPGNDFAGLRDRFILELLYSTGCRVSEVSGAGLSDLDIKSKTLRVCGKGGKERIVYLGNEAMKALAGYLPLRNIRADKTDQDALNALLINVRGRRITQRGIALIIEKYIKVSGISKKVSPHTFRHSFATHLVDHGADIRMVQEMLGHESLSTTQIYTHMGIEKLRNVYRQAHPHAGKQNDGVSN